MTALSEHRFGAGPAFTIGVEEELLLVDGRGAPSDTADCVLEHARCADGRFAAEVHRCMVELVTPVCRHAGEAEAVLREMRAAIGACGEAAIGSGVHPEAPPDSAAVTGDERYRRIRESLGDAIGTAVAGMHVHVGMPDPETAVEVCNALRADVPLLVALGANSPVWHGHDSGLASVRHAAMGAWPRSGIPRAFDGFADFCALAERLARAAEVPDSTWFWWAVRPHPRIGTVEVRAVDAQTDVRDVAALAALVQGLAMAAADGRRPPVPADELLDEAFFRATRYGTGATLPDPDGRLLPLADVLAEAVERAAPYARDAGSGAALDGLERLVAEGGGAGRQRGAFAEGGTPGLLAWLMQRTRGAADATARHDLRP